MMSSIQKQREANRLKTWVIMSFFTLFFATLAFLLGKASGEGFSLAFLTLFFAGLTSFGSYYWGDKLILKLSGARRAQPKKEADFYTAAQKVAWAFSLPLPKLYLLEEEAPNAFATGRDKNHASICVTSGLLKKLTPEELEGVIAHEMAHIQNLDIRLMTIVSVLVGSIALLSDIFFRWAFLSGEKKGEREEKGSGEIILFVLSLILALFSPLIATLIQLAISRQREYLADATGAFMTKNPKGLALALEKIAASPIPLAAASNATAHLYIVNPFKDRKFSHFLAGLFETHPPIEERIKILREMEKS